jgi:hypothetical protein
MHATISLKSIALYLIVVSLIASSCARRRAKRQPANSSTVVIDTLQTPQPDSLLVKEKLPLNPTEALDLEIAEIKISEIDFIYFSSNSRLHFKTPNETQNATINFRIKKDSLIWFSISGFGLEAVRGIISQDSIMAIDKLHREYYKFDFETLSQTFNFDLSFDLLQSLVLGNLPLKKRGKNKFVKKENDYYLLQQEDGKVLIDNYIGQSNRKLRKLQVSKGEDTQNKLTMTFGDFQAINEHVFPYESLLTVDYKKAKDDKQYETLVELKHKKVEFSNSPLNFPFTIPANYSAKKQ